MACASSSASIEARPLCAAASDVPISLPTTKGALTDRTDFSFTVTITSNDAATVAAMPTQTPEITAYCGITPEASLTVLRSLPYAERADAPSHTTAPILSKNPITGAPFLIAMR